MLADDLLGPIALDQLSTGIPVGDPAQRIQHVDGIVRDALNEQTKASLALQGRKGRLPLLRDVACDLGKSDQLVAVALVFLGNLLTAWEDWEED